MDVYPNSYNSNKEDIFWYRWFWDNIQSFIVVGIVLNIFAGIIIDEFSTLMQKVVDEEKDQN